VLKRMAARAANDGAAGGMGEYRRHSRAEEAAAAIGGNQEELKRAATASTGVALMIRRPTWMRPLGIRRSKIGGADAVYLADAIFERTFIRARLGSAAALGA